MNGAFLVYTRATGSPEASRLRAESGSVRDRYSLSPSRAGSVQSVSYTHLYNSRSSYGQQKELPPEITPKKVPEDYVDEAERIMRSLMSQPKKVTTSKIRGLLSLVTEIFNVENLRTEEALLPESVVKINLMRVRVAYEYGRDTGESVGKDKALSLIHI